MKKIIVAILLLLVLLQIISGCANSSNAIQSATKTEATTLLNSPTSEVLTTNNTPTTNEETTPSTTKYISMYKFFSINYNTADGYASVSTVQVSQNNSSVFISMSIQNRTDKNMTVFPISVNLYNASGEDLGSINVTGPFLTPNTELSCSGSGLINSPFVSDIEIADIDVFFNVCLS